MSKKAALEALQSIYKQALQAPRYNDGSTPHTSLTGLQALSNSIPNTVVDCKNESKGKEVYV